nr:hypothetical protein [Tanacetum cinerariifolium]
MFMLIMLDFCGGTSYTVSSRRKIDLNKDDILLVSVYTTRNVTVRWMLILGEFLIDEIRDTKEYKEYEKVFVRIDIPTIQPQPDKSTQGTNRTPKATRTPTPTTEVV